MGVYQSKFTGEEIDELLSSIQESTKTIIGVKQVSLWEGNLATSDTSITFSESLENFDYILVGGGYRNANGEVRSAPMSAFRVTDIKSNGYGTSNEYQLDGIGQNQKSTTYLLTCCYFESSTQAKIKFVVTGELYPYVSSVIGIKCNGSSSGTSNTPIGTIISYMGLTAPEDYLVCDGSVLNISDYPKLAEHFETQFGTKNHFGGDGSITFALPDLRNEFLRGYGDISGEIGEHQEATQIANYRAYSDSSNGLFYIPAKQNYNQGGANADERIATTSEVHKFTTTTLQSDSGTLTYYSARPTNVAVLYCIKYTVSDDAIASENNGVYSTTETKVGTWIDGKTLYKRVVVLNGLGTLSTTASLFPHNIPNVDTIYISEGFVKGNSGVSFPLTNTSRYFAVDTTTIRVALAEGEVDYSTYNATVVLQYTKVD